MLRYPAYGYLQTVSGHFKINRPFLRSTQTPINFIMKKVLVLGLIIALTWSSCKKDIGIPSSPTPHSYSELTTGNYWVYDWYVIDSAGSSTLCGITDSIYIVGDTVIGSDTFAIQKGSWFGGATTLSFRRDSLGYLINETGRVFFSATNFTDTLYIWNSMTGSETGFLKMTDIGQTMTVPAGTFTTLNAEYTVVNNVGTWPCVGTLDIHNNQYADHVGKVKSTFQFTSDPSCKVYEQRLRKYYVN